MILEHEVREVKLGWGVVVARFYDPPHSHVDGAPDPVERWRVLLPSWFPTGSWLGYDHAFKSLDDALIALDETGALNAITEYWHARQAASSARQAAFSKIMAAHGRRDKSYSELLIKRQSGLRRTA